MKKKLQIWILIAAVADSWRAVRGKGVHSPPGHPRRHPEGADTRLPALAARLPAREAGPIRNPPQRNNQCAEPPPSSGPDLRSTRED